MQTRPSSLNGQADRRCVVWVPPEGAAPTRLLAALAQRQLSAVVLLDAPSVMWQLAHGPVVALIVVEPGCQPHLAELVSAVRVYYPQVVLWQYDTAGKGLTSLAPVAPLPSPEDVCGEKPQETASSKAEFVPPLPDHMPNHASTAVQRQGEPCPTATSLPSESHAASLRPTLISQEELDMLLGPIESLESEPPRS